MIGRNEQHDLLLDDDADVSRSSLESIAEYAQGIGPAISLAWPDNGLVRNAHELKLLVHPFTFRADELPDGCGSFDELLTTFLDVLKVDGLFTDFPDRVVRHARQLG